jgi:ketosteroid isomerase-like protein
MSQENVELVKRLNAALATGGVEATLAYFPPDVVAYAFPEWVEEAEYRGHDGQRALVAVWTENFDEFEVHIEEIRAVGDRVLMLGETAGRVKRSGVSIRQPLGVVYSDFRDGLIGEWRSFLTWAQAMEAARAGGPGSSALDEK